MDIAALKRETIEIERSTNYKSDVRVDGSKLETGMYDLTNNDSLDEMLEDIKGREIVFRMEVKIPFLYIEHVPKKV